MSGKNKKLSKALLSLSGAAVVLLGDETPLSAATVDENINVNYRVSKYEEAKTEETERYDISIHQFRLTSPMSNTYNVGVNVVYETMTGASPWYVVPDQDGKPIQVMSGATIEEERQDVNVNASKIMDETTLSAAVGNSQENDYDATYYKLAAEHDLLDKHLTVFGGVATSNDDIHPTDADLFQRVKSEKKKSNSVYVGVSRVINKKLLASTSLSYTTLSGFLSDPYKQVRIVDGSGTSNIIGDSRPSEKTQIAWSSKMRFHLGSDMTLHLDYRYFRDNWELTSHTVSTTLYKNIATHWQISQELRYYNQSKAYFYAPYYNGVRADGYYSSDYRLSPYGAISGRFKLTYKNDDMDFHFALEKYRSDGSLALKEVKIEHPGLVEFMVITLGIDIKFRN